MSKKRSGGVKRTDTRSQVYPREAGAPFQTRHLTLQRRQRSQGHPRVRKPKERHPDVRCRESPAQSRWKLRLELTVLLRSVYKKSPLPSRGGRDPQHPQNETQHPSEPPTPPPKHSQHLGSNAPLEKPQQHTPIFNNFRKQLNTCRSTVQFIKNLGGP